MRQRMRTELSQAKPGEFDVKQDAGGIADIEFLVDYWVLARSAEYPDARRVSGQRAPARGARARGLVPAERCRQLKDAYLALRQCVHELALDERRRVVAGTEFVAVRAFVADVWNEVFAGVAGE